MSIKSREILKTFFETGDTPSAEEFMDLIDSFLHRDEDRISEIDAPESDEKTVTALAVKNYFDKLLTGSVAAFAMETPPDGWVECDGRMVDLNRESDRKYEALFHAIEKRYGPGNGSAKSFNLPNLQGLFIRGLDRDNLHDPGRVLGTLQEDQFQNHRHNDAGHSHADNGHSHSDAGHSHPCYHGNFSWPGGGGAEYSNANYGNWHGNHTGHANITTGYASIRSGNAQITDPVESTAGNPRIGMETRPVNVALLYCIKY